jgi:hypothetical protein
MAIECLTGCERPRGATIRLFPSVRQIVSLAVVMISSVILLSVFSNFKQAIPLIRPFSLDEFFMKADYFLHGGHHPWMLIHPIAGIPWVTKLIDSAYVCWFPALYFFLTGFGLGSDDRLRCRYFVSFILVWVFAGSVFAVLLSSAGPCYYARLLPGPDPFSPLMGYLRSVHEARFLFAVKFQEGLWAAHAAKENLTFGGVSAMPSVHVATAVLFACAGFSVHRLLGYAFAVYAVIIQIGSVHLGWHYAVDGYFGAIIAIAFWRFSDRMYPTSTP